MIMVTPTAIDRVKIISPKQAKREQQATIAIAVVDASGKPINAIIPLEVQISDAQGRAVERSGHWAAIGGKLVIPIDIAPNDNRRRLANQRS